SPAADPARLPERHSSCHRSTRDATETGGAFSPGARPIGARTAPPGELSPPLIDLALRLGHDVTHISAEPHVTRMLGTPGADVRDELGQRGAQGRYRVGRQLRHHGPAAIAPQVRLEARGRLAPV